MTRQAPGIVTEGSKLVDTDFDLQRGFVVEIARERVNLALDAYNVGTDDFYTVVSFALGL
jgi:hypothetical protein